CPHVKPLMSSGRHANSPHRAGCAQSCTTPGRLRRRTRALEATAGSCAPSWATPLNRPLPYLCFRRLLRGVALRALPQRAEDALSLAVVVHELLGLHARAGMAIGKRGGTAWIDAQRDIENRALAAHVPGRNEWQAFQPLVVGPCHLRPSWIARFLGFA